MEKTTIEIDGISFDVEYWYEPAERMVMYYPDGSGYPGSPASVDIVKILYKGVDIKDLLYALSGNLVEKIENKVLEYEIDEK